MSNLVVAENRIPAMTDQAIAKVRELEQSLLLMPQGDVDTWHVIHGGMYARTILVPAGVVLTGALVNVPTMLIVNGHVMVYIGDEVLNMSGHNVLAASKGRKQGFYAVTDTWLTMVFATDAKTVEDAENEFTDEADKLMSRKPTAKNLIIITGE
jgi:hypothetical protein